MEPKGEYLEPGFLSDNRVGQESVPPRELSSLTKEGLGRIYDLKQAGHILESVGLGLPVERKQELDKSISLGLEEQVGSNMGGADLVTDASARERMAGFLAKWDQKTLAEQNSRISTAIKLFGTEELDDKAFAAKKQGFINDIATVDKQKTSQRVEELSRGDIEDWDDLRTRENLNRADQQKLNKLRERAKLELDKALGAIGMDLGPIPLLVNRDVRKRYGQLLKDPKKIEKLIALQARLQIRKGPEAQSNETSTPFTHETFQGLLLNRVNDMKTTLRNSGDYRLCVVPMRLLEYAEKQCIPTITADNNDLDGTLRLTQSIIMNVGNQFKYRREDIPRVGALRELAGMLPRKEAASSQGPSLSEEELSQRKDLSKRLDDLRVVMENSGDSRLWTASKQVNDTANALLGEIVIGGDNPSTPAMIKDRLKMAEGITSHHSSIFDRR